ncbi:hypothetical protein B1813_20050 [Saccharomonospora piscinae]|uniref:Uncharacterized protein n=1 Tax=Saccharomonospora piscinae TaxID=687388 RepID=A0A1V8ZZD0_SACPI|nr:hypothetical protein B1813_20050 [Saccharomonospora piscinae]
MDVPEGWRPETAIDGIRLSPPPEGSLLFGVMGENDEVADDLVRDITEVLTSMCARLYGRRSAKKRAQNGVAACAAEP